MSGKCLITIPQDNQCKPSMFQRTKNFTQHIRLHELSLEDTTSWADLKTETLVTSPFIIRPHLICKSPIENYWISPTCLLGADHLLGCKLHSDNKAEGVNSKTHPSVSVQDICIFLKTLLPFLLLLWKWDIITSHHETIKMILNNP